MRGWWASAGADGWTVRIRGNPDLALRDWDHNSYWAGEFTVPFADVVTDDAVRAEIEEQAARFTAETEHVLASDGPGLDGPLRAALGVGRQPGQAAFAEDPCGHVRDPAVGAPRAEERSAVTERLEEGGVAHARCVAERHGELALDPADGHGVISTAAAATSSRSGAGSRGRK